MNIKNQELEIEPRSGVATRGELPWLKECLPRLEIMGVQLSETSVQVEEAVVQICRNFQGIADQAHTTAHRTAGFMGTGNAGWQKKTFNALIQNCGVVLKKSLNTAAEASEASKQAIERIKKMDEASKEINLSMMKLEEISSGNKILALNARIEAVRSGVQGGGFEAVAVELGAQTEKSKIVTAAVGDLAENLRVLAESTMTDLRDLQSQAEKRIEACKIEVNEALADMRKAHEEMEDMMHAMTEDGKKIAADVQSAVRGLQFQDAVSQRIGHVVEDLGTLRKKLAAYADGNSDPETFSNGGFSAYTMQAERAAANLFATEQAGGEIELF
jgi:methyl-accepting chemotaxis protein